MKRYEIQKKITAVRGDTDEYLKEVMKIEMMRESMNEMERRIEEANKKLAATETQFASILHKISAKEQMICETVEQAKHMVGKYKARYTS